jgi:hypothetical protein
MKCSIAALAGLAWAGLAWAGLALAWAGAAFAQAEPGKIAGTPCVSPPALHCPDSDCQATMVINQGDTVEPKTRRAFFLDCPADYKPGDKVILVLALHGAGSYANWQRNYFPLMDYKDKYHLVIATPSSPYHFWQAADDEYLANIVDLLAGSVGKQNVTAFWLVGHSQGGTTSNQIICSDYFKDKVDVRISLSGGRIGPTTPAGKGFGGGYPPVYRSGEPAQPQPPFRFPPQSASGPPGGACDYSFLFSNGENESTPAATSPLADKFQCGPRVELADVIDPKAGLVWDSTRQDPGTDGWGHYPKSGRALVYQFPGCKDGRVIADVVRLQKGHTEGYEPNITEEIIKLAAQAKGGKIATGAWNPPAPPAPFQMFGPPPAGAVAAPAPKS